MGSQTRANIVAAGLKKAGYPSITTDANGWLNKRLRTYATKWKWPYLCKRLTQVSIGQNATSILFGKGSGGESMWVQEIFNPMFVYSPDFSRKGKVFIKEIVNDESIWNDEALNNPVYSYGMPYQVKLAMVYGTPGQFKISPFLVPDIAYYFAIDYRIIPDDLATDTSADSSVPWYPNDETMIEGVAADALDYMKQYKARDGKEIYVDKLIAQDLVAHGAIQGFHTNVGLDPAVYRNDNTTLYPWPT